MFERCLKMAKSGNTDIRKYGTEMCCYLVNDSQPSPSALGLSRLDMYLHFDARQAMLGAMV